MKILAIETSCDETAVCILEAKGGVKKPVFKLLSNSLFSQAKLHEEFGGVYPNLARREHQKNLIPLFLTVTKKLIFSSTKSRKTNSKQIPKSKSEKIKKILEREPELLEQFEKHIFHLPKPKIDKIAVTVGPGLEPALWVGISFAKALSALWDIPVVPVNHMKGHFLAPLAEGEKIEFPALGLLISGGHTELVVAKDPTSYKIIGKTVDDACGEAYDKVARILGLPYPGGPQISALAEISRKNAEKTLRIAKKNQRDSASTPHGSAFSLPRPMLHSKDLNFSFSGLKTAVLYLVKKIQDSKFNNLDSVRSQIAQEFEESVKDVLVKKTEKALRTYKVKTLVVGGGVSANTYIKKHLEILAKKEKVKILVSSKSLATDNAVMTAVAGFFAKEKPISKIKAEGNLSL